MIYLDNAATTHIKPPGVINAVSNYIRLYNSNSGRAGHKLAIYSGEKIYECRENIARLFNISDPSSVCFTLNTTFALNYAIHGFLSEGDHVVIGGMEHNSVLRPLAAHNISYSIAPATKEGLVTQQAVRSKILDNTKLIIINHASNIVGTVNPIYEIGKVAKEYNIPFLVDSAQSAGVLDIDVKLNNISMLAFAGHKMLYGPSGTGGLYVSPKIKLKTIIEGGTGSSSENGLQPDFMPDMLESGTMNSLGIVGLNEGVKFVLESTPKALYSYEKALTNRLIEGLSNINGIEIYGGKSRVGVVGFNLKNMDCVELCSMLNDEYNIASRGGFHCAIIAHRSIGTEKSGLARLSVSAFNENYDIDKAIEAVYKISKQNI